ncbi:MAG: hypothetical protein A49_06340 [Methyloceanibacter sp.]|nr:MAG: hypothetical protein A49_06340 [Methyloceanibacter sp.]
MGQRNVWLTRMGFLGGALLGGPLMIETAAAGTCDNAAPPYDIPSQNATVNLDADCGGAGGTANVTGNVDGGANRAIFDAAGNEQDWAIVVLPGVSVVNSATNATMEFRSPNGSVDNSGTIQQSGGANAIYFNDGPNGDSGPGSVTNRGTGQILGTTSATIRFDAGGTLVNEAGGLIRSTGGSAVSTIGFVDVTNAGTIETTGGATSSAISGNSGATVMNSGTINGRVNFFSGGTATITNSGTITGVAGQQAIRIFGIDATVITSGAINAGAGYANAIEFISAGTHTLELQPGFSIAGVVFGGPGADTLRFGGTGTETFNLDDIDTGSNTQQYQNFETFEVSSGKWSFSGATTQNFTVNGGTVKGTGTFGDLTVNGGTVAPGNSIGTMTVNNFTLGSGAVYEVEVNAAGQSDKVIANGAVNLTGAALRVLAENGNYKPKTEYTIIQKDSAGAVTGEFDSISTNYAFLTPAVDYSAGDGNDVVLTLLRTVVPSTGGGGNGGGGSGGGGSGGSGGSGGTSYLSFCSVANTKNQCNVAHALDKFPTDNPLFLSVLTQTAPGSVQCAVRRSARDRGGHLGGRQPLCA